MARKDAETQQRFVPYWNLYLAENPLTDASKKLLDDLRQIGVRLNMEYTRPAPKRTLGDDTGTKFARNADERS